MTKQTKAERVFSSTYRAARNLYRADETTAYNALCSDELITAATVKNVLKECDREENHLGDYEKFGLITAEDAADRRLAVQIVRNTCHKWLKEDAEREAYFKALAGEQEEVKRTGKQVEVCVGTRKYKRAVYLTNDGIEVVKFDYKLYELCYSEKKEAYHTCDLDFARWMRKN